jgi:hypothetical protein
VVELPTGVHRVIAGGREYFYWQPGRGTKHAAKAVAIKPADPHDPAFWVELRRLQGLNSGTTIKTFAAVCDLFETSAQFNRLSKGTKDQYRRQLHTAKVGFGSMAAEGVRASMIRGVVEGLADKPGTADNFLGVMRALSEWAVVREHFPASITAGVKPYEKVGGHRPWTATQLAAAEKHLTGMVRRAFMLARYTGQRGSDVVRLGETFLDEGGFRIAQQKTGREVWCPIDDALAAEMATWERVPGPYVRQANGRPYNRKRLDVHFSQQRALVAELAGATLHGLRSTRLIELRQLGLTTTQIQDQIGMSLAMIERYCRFADKKASGKASIITLAERRKNSGL